MKILVELEYWQAVRLKSLVNDGFRILAKDDRSQRGIDGYTTNDLRKLRDELKLEDSPKFANSPD